MVLYMSHSSRLTSERIKSVMRRTPTLKTQMPDKYTRINKGNMYCCNKNLAEIRQPTKETEKKLLKLHELYKLPSLIVQSSFSFHLPQGWPLGKNACFDIIPLKWESNLLL